MVYPTPWKCFCNRLLMFFNEFLHLLWKLAVANLICMLSGRCQGKSCRNSSILFLPQSPAVEAEQNQNLIYWLDCAQSKSQCKSLCINYSNRMLTAYSLLGNTWPLHLKNCPIKKMKYCTQLPDEHHFTFPVRSGSGTAKHSVEKQSVLS